MSTEIEIKKNQEVANAQSNVWVNDASDRDDIIFPRAKIFHGTASEFEQYPNSKPGMIINHLTGEELPTTFLPFLRFKQYAKFNPRNSSDAGFNRDFEPGSLVWMTMDSTDPRVKETKFDADGNKPTAVEFMNFMSIFEGQTFPIVIAFSKTSLKAGKKLFSMLAYSGGQLNRKFKLVTKKRQSDGNTFFVYDVEPAGLATDDEVKLATMLHSQFSTKTHEIKVEEHVDWKE